MLHGRGFPQLAAIIPRSLQDSLWLLDGKLGQVHAITLPGGDFMVKKTVNKALWVVSQTMEFVSHLISTLR